MEYYREYKCIVCGKKTVDRSSNGHGKFCSRKCDWISKHGACRFNEGVVCDGSKCDECGWSPEVEKFRKECLV